jgi:hypothetical protein
MIAACVPATRVSDTKHPETRAKGTQAAIYFGVWFCFPCLRGKVGMGMLSKIRQSDGCQIVIQTAK